MSEFVCYILHWSCYTGGISQWAILCSRPASSEPRCSAAMVTWYCLCRVSLPKWCVNWRYSKSKRVQVQVSGCMGASWRIPWMLSWSCSFIMRRNGRIAGLPEHQVGCVDSGLENLRRENSEGSAKSARRGRGREVIQEIEGIREGRN